MSASNSRPSQAAPEDSPADPAAPAQAGAASPDWQDGWFTFHVADVSDEAAAEVTRAGAWPAFMAFSRLLWKRQREAAKAGNDKRHAALRAGVLDGEGIKGLARSIGADPKAIARQLARLEEIGVLRVYRPPATFARDAAGRLARRPVAKGLVQPVRIAFVAGDKHKRPANRQGYSRPSRPTAKRTRQGYVIPSAGQAPEGMSGTAPISPKHTSLSAGGLADGIGRPAEGRPQLRCFTDEDIEYTRRKLAAEQEARDAADRARWAEEDAREVAEAARREQEAKEAPEPAPAPLSATEAARSLTEAVAALPAASRTKARREARRLAREASREAEEVKKLVDLVNRKRAEGHGGPPLDAKAFKEEAKAASRRARRRRPMAAAREAVGA